MVRNPVMFVVEVGALFVTSSGSPGESGTERWFSFVVALWLWLTVVFGNLAEALAEGRGKAQAATLRAMRSETVAHAGSDGGDKAGRRAARAATAWWSRRAR